MMKLLIVIVDARDARGLREALVEAGIRFTELGSTGGFLRLGSMTLLIGLAADQVDEVIELVAANCRRREEVIQVTPADTRTFADPVGDPRIVTLGGAQVFVLSVEQIYAL